MTGTNPHRVGKTSGSVGPSTCLLGVNLVRLSSATAGRGCLIRSIFPGFNPLYFTGSRGRSKSSPMRSASARDTSE